MPRIVQTCIVSLAAAAGAAQAADLPVNAAQEAALLREAGPDFSIKRTQHFLVAHNSDPAIVTTFVSRVEQTYRGIFRFCEIHRIPAGPPDQRLEVIFYDRRDEFDSYARSIRFPATGIYGVYFERNNRSVFYNVNNDPELQQIHADIAAARANLEELTASLRALRGRAQIELTYSDGRRVVLSRQQAQRELGQSRAALSVLDNQRGAYAERINQTVVQHEVTHQILFNAGVHVRGAANPKWLVEGLACLFETPPDSSNTGSGVFAINQLRLGDFRSAIARTREGATRLSAADFIEAIHQGVFSPPERMVSRSDVFDARGDAGAANYALAWSLAHFLQRERPAELAAYMREISARPVGSTPQPGEELALFVRHFGPLDEAVLNRWGGYILRLPVRSLSRGLTTHP